MLPEILKKEVPSKALMAASLVGSIGYLAAAKHTSLTTPPCPFYHFFSIECPGCGSVRSIEALLEADFYSAFSYNLLVIPTIGLCLLYIILPKTARSNFLRSNGVVFTLIGFVFAFWLARLAPWPYLEFLKAYR